MKVYVDTSAFMAVLDAGDAQHSAARRTWEEIIGAGHVLICNNYVLVETIALTQRRLGMDAARVFSEDIYPLLEVEWIDGARHTQAAEALFVANRRALSLVDCTSFATARRAGADAVFAFDKHFSEQGFFCIPDMRLSGT